VAAECGDNIVQTIEECDFGDAMDGDGCSASCEWEARIVFTTSTTYDGNLGGLAGADAICNARAQAAGLPGTYMAWISTNQGSPSTRFVQSAVPYLLRTGSKVADNWADLTDGTIDFNINRNEFGALLVNMAFTCNNSPRPVWTGTNADGTAAANNCSNFSSNAMATTGAVGRSSITDATWSLCGAAVACNNLAPIYCFQQ
jgi:cysteine-rich repeat protein